MLSDFEPKSLFSVQVRIGTQFSMHVGSCDSHDFYRAKEYAVQVLRWLHRGHFYALPDEVLRLRDIITAHGFDPAAAVVEVLELPEIAPGRYLVANAQVWFQAIDCVAREDAEEPEELEPTVPEFPPRPVTVRAIAR